MIPTKHAAVLAGDIRFWLNAGFSKEELGHCIGEPLPAACTDLRLPVGKVKSLFDYTYSRMRDPFMGLHIGQQIRFTDVSVIADLIHYFRDGWQAMSVLETFWPLLSEVQEFRLQQHAEIVTVQIMPTDVSLVHHQQNEAWVASFLNIANLMLGINQAEHVQALFCRVLSPAQTEQVSRELGVTVLTGQPLNGIAFSAAILETPNPCHDEVRFQAAWQRARRQLQALEEQSLANNILLLLQEQLPDHLPDQESIARQLNMSVRKLQRHLQEQNTSFRQLLDAARHNAALDLLGQSAMPLPEIASLLGYDDPASFFKAFKRWEGQTPGEYRQHLKLQPAATCLFPSAGKELKRAVPRQS